MYAYLDTAARRWKEAEKYTRKILYRVKVMDI